MKQTSRGLFVAACVILGVLTMVVSLIFAPARTGLKTPEPQPPSPPATPSSPTTPPASAR